MSKEVIKKSKKTVELGGKHCPLWKIVRNDDTQCRKEIEIIAEIDGEIITATALNDDWIRSAPAAEEGRRRGRGGKRGAGGKEK